MADARRCPKCQSENIFRSRRRSLEYLLPLLRPFRCYSCERRFLLFAPKAQKSRRIRLEGRPVSNKNT